MLFLHFIQHKANNPMSLTKKKMFKVTFFLRNAESAKPSDLLTIYCQLEIEGHHRDTPFSTKLKVPKCSWHKQTVSNDYLWGHEINQKLIKITTTFRDIYQAQLVMNEQVTYSSIRSQYDPTSLNSKIKRSTTFFEAFDQMLAKRIKTKKLSDGTIRNYAIRRQNLFEFFKEHFTTNILVEEIRYRHVEKLMEVFRGKYTNGHGNKHAHAIKSTLDYALKEELIKFNPLGKLDLENDLVKPPCYLLSQHRAAIALVNTPRLEKARDISVFLMYTGFSYTDYRKLQSKHLVSSAEGLCFKIDRNKSKNYSLPPCLPEAVEIIKKYGSIEALPRPNINDLNKLLKFLGFVAGITEETVGFELSTSVFRETFASMMENEYMAHERTIMHMMGHTSPKQLNNYSRVMPARILHEFKQQGIKLDIAS